MRQKTARQNTQVDLAASCAAELLFIFWALRSDGHPHVKRVRRAGERAARVRELHPVGAACRVGAPKLVLQA
jgi:hypothetical protein